MEEAFVSLVTAFLLDNNEISSHPNSSNPLAQASEVHQAPVEEEEVDGDHDCYDFIPSFKDFMVPQRDRAFSWDVSFENGLHSDMAGAGNGSILPTNLHDLFPTHHQASTGPSVPEDTTKLTIKAKFPAKSSAKRTASDSNASLPVIKTEGKRKDSFGGIDHLDHEDILDDDDDAADDFFEDPLLLSIPPDLLIEGSGLSLQQSSSNKKSRSRATGGSSKEDKPNKRSKTTPSNAKSHQNETISPPTASSSGLTHSQDLYLSVVTKPENGLGGAGAGKALDSHYSASAGIPGGYAGNGHSVLSAGTTSASSNSYLSSLSSGSHGYNHSSLNGGASVGMKPGGGSLNYANPLNTLAYSNYNHNHPNQPYSAYSSSTSAGSNLNHSHHGHHGTSHHHHHHHSHAMHEKRVGIYTIEERRMKIEKFREKKRQRIWRKQIKYDCRKRLADTRPRVKGRFVSRKNQGADGGNPFGSPCGSKDATTNEQSDEDDSVGGNSGGLHMHPPATTPMMMSTRQPAVSGSSMTNMKYPQSQPLTATVGGLHNQTTLSSQYGGYHHALPSSLNDKGEYSIGGSVLAHTSSTASSTTSTGNNHHHYNYPGHSSLSSSSSSSLHTHHHYVPPSYNTIGNTASLLNQQVNNTSNSVNRFAAPLSTIASSVNAASVPMSIGGTTIPQSHSQTPSTSTATGTPAVSGYGIHQSSTTASTIGTTTTQGFNHSSTNQPLATATNTGNVTPSSSMYPPTTNTSHSTALPTTATESQQQYRSYPTTTIGTISSSTSHTCEATKTADRIL
mmetsp:Transcript_10077/g.10896  ORF Transcript_10077/g.10896 Transcript_10077/m.10896 type:complete len:788 (+) Transcript_10077:241-2604(+)